MIMRPDSTTTLILVGLTAVGIALDIPLFTVFGGWRRALPPFSGSPGAVRFAPSRCLVSFAASRAAADAGELSSSSPSAAARCCRRPARRWCAL